METEKAPINGHGLLTMADDVWDLARRRADVIAPLAGLRIVGRQAVDEASQELSISRRHVYLLIKRYREGSGLVTDVAPKQSSGGQGKGRLPGPVEAVIEELIRKQYLSRQKLSEAALYREVIQAWGLPRDSLTLKQTRGSPILCISGAMDLLVCSRLVDFCGGLSEAEADRVINPVRPILHAIIDATRFLCLTYSYVIFDTFRIEFEDYRGIEGN